MKSKYLDIKKLRQPLDLRQCDAKSRKQTKPKRTYKMHPTQQKQTQSDTNGITKYQYQKKSKLLIKNIQKQVGIINRQPSKFRYSVTQSSHSQSNDFIDNQQIQESKKQSFNQTKKMSQVQNTPNFIGQLNTYLKQLKRSKLDLKQNQSKNKKQNIPLKNSNLQQQNQMQNTILKSNNLENKIQKEKKINRNLQKCIIQIQKVLWDRNDKLQILQKQIRRQSKQKENYMRKMNQYNRNNISKTIFFDKDFGSKKQSFPINAHRNIIFHENQSALNELSKISSQQKKHNQLFETYSDTQRQSSVTFKQRRPRRKTQTPINMEKCLGRTLEDREAQKIKTQKSYNKFQKGQLHNI